MAARHAAVVAAAAAAAVVVQQRVGRAAAEAHGQQLLPIGVGLGDERHHVGK